MQSLRGCPRGGQMFRASDRSVEQVIAAFLTLGVALTCFVPVQAQQAETKAQSAETVTVPVQTMERLQQHLADLECEGQQLKSQMNDMQSTMRSEEHTSE